MPRERPLELPVGVVLTQYTDGPIVGGIQPISVTCRSRRRYRPRSLHLQDGPRL